MRDNYWPEIAIVTSAAVMLSWALVQSQEAVVINTGVPDRVLEAGRPVESPPTRSVGYINKFGAVIDRANHTNQEDCFDVEVQKMDDVSKTWTLVAASRGFCGRTTPPTKNGQPITSSAIFITDTENNSNFDRAQWKTVVVPTSGSPRTSVAIHMSEIK